MSRALIVVDVQNDFCEGGSLAVTGGAAVAAGITDHLAGGHEYAAVVATLDWHVDPGHHFSDHPDYVDTWPVHCVVGTGGSLSHPALDRSLVEEWFHKGRYEAAYSGFQGRTEDAAGTEAGTDGSDAGLSTGGSGTGRSAADGSAGAGALLADWLRERGVTAVDVVGIATDHCVKATALDAVTAGFETRVLLHLTAGVAPATTRTALDQLSAAGAHLVGAPAGSGQPRPER